MDIFEECTICLENINIEYGNIKKLKCKHIYHINCINEWFKNKKNTCPNCRLTQYTIETISPNDLDNIQINENYNMCTYSVIFKILIILIYILLVLYILLK